MAKLECTLYGDFSKTLNILESEILKSSASITEEDRSDYTLNGVQCAVRVYERYSVLGGNRVSLNITLIGNNEKLLLSAITSGGSQAVFYKLNTLGEESFLDCVKNIVNKYV